MKEMMHSAAWASPAHRIMRDTIICDLDGTLFDIEHRRHFVEKVPGKKRDFKAFEAAIPNDMINYPIACLIERMGLSYNVIFVTGRHERTRLVTEKQLRRAGWYYPKLYMRADDDYRSDYDFKQDVLVRYLEPARILFCIDDRDQVVRMWRFHGLTCLQVADGNF